MTWEGRTLTTDFVAEGCCFGGMTGDGRRSFVAGDCFWPDETPEQPVRFRAVEAAWLPAWTPLDRIDPTPHLRQGGGPPRYRDATYDWAVDLTDTGRDDVIWVGMHTHAIRWCENPGEGAERIWSVHEVAPAGGAYESVARTALPGVPIALVTVPKKPFVAWYAPGPDARLPWKPTLIGDRGGDWHGLGVFDIDGDGHPEVVTAAGFYRMPDGDPSEWTWVPVRSVTETGAIVEGFGGVGPLGLIGIERHDSAAEAMVVGSSPHGRGLWTWVKVDESATGWLFERRLVDDRFSQLHALTTVAVDGETCVVTGKRPLAHGEGVDAGWDEPAVVMAYWFRGGELRDIEVVDEGAGVGLSVAAEVVDDVLRVGVSSRNGVRIFTRSIRQD